MFLAHSSTNLIPYFWPFLTFPTWPSSPTCALHLFFLVHLSYINMPTCRVLYSCHVIDFTHHLSSLARLTLFKACCNNLVFVFFSCALSLNLCVTPTPICFVSGCCSCALTLCSYFCLMSTHPHMCVSFCLYSYAFCTLA